MLTVYGANQHRIPLDALLSEPHKLHSMRRENGKVLLEVSHDRSNIKIWLNPAVNFLADKVVMETGDSADAGTIGTHAVSRFVELLPGIFFPEGVEVSIEDKKTKAITLRIGASFTDIAIDRPLPATAFDFRFPPNLLVGDGVNNRMMKTDAQGQPTIQAKARSGELLRLGLGEIVPQTPKEPPGGGTVTQEEPRSWNRWILPASFLLLGLAGVIWTTRRILSKKRSQAPEQP